MVINHPVFVKSASQISIQQPLCDDWIDNPLIPSGEYNEAVDPSFREYLSAGEARRLGKIMKRAVATSATALRDAGIECPDAIITATGLGCVKNTELFLTDLCTIGENLLKPTQFMQSTHNTIGSLVAILNKCHGYNVTYAHKEISFEVALLDAVMQLSLGNVGNVLVGAHDEMTPLYYQMLCRIGFLGAPGMVTSGETAVAVVLDTDSDGALCRLSDIGVNHKPSARRIGSVFERLVEEHGGIDTVIVGDNGADTGQYDEIVSRYFADATVLRYKNLFGESFTASSFGVYAGVTVLGHGRYPQAMIVRDSGRQMSNVLCLNCADGNDMAHVLLTKCN